MKRANKPGGRPQGNFTVQSFLRLQTLTYYQDRRIAALIAAGDELADSIEIMRAQADVWVGPRVVTALQAWRDINHEAGEGRG